MKNFQFIPPTIAEHKKARRKGVELKCFLDDGCQPVNGFSQIGTPSSEVHTGHRGRIQHNVFNTFTTSARSKGLNPCFTSIEHSPIFTWMESSSGNDESAITKDAHFVEGFGVALEPSIRLSQYFSW